MDWWEIRRTDEIESSFVGGTDIRGPVQAAYPTLPGPVLTITSPYENLGVDEPKGLDYALQSKFELGAAGTLGFDIEYSHLISQKVCHTSDPTTCVDSGAPTVRPELAAIPARRATAPRQRWTMVSGRQRPG